ncbi:MAG: hypothetical protein ABSA44_13810 [Bacteroidota bacterium]|jgi:hypothetical protein
MNKIIIITLVIFSIPTFAQNTDPISRLPAPAWFHIDSLINNQNNLNLHADFVRNFLCEPEDTNIYNSKENLILRNPLPISLHEALELAEKYIEYYHVDVKELVLDSATLYTKIKIPEWVVSYNSYPRHTSVIIYIRMDRCMRHDIIRGM